MPSDGVEDYLLLPLPWPLPKTVRAAPLPLPSQQDGAPARLCVILSCSATEETWSPVPLSVTRDCQVWLAALMDAAGQVHAWLELWSMGTHGMGSATGFGLDELEPNCVKDDRWDAWLGSLHGREGARAWGTGFEGQPVGPLVLDKLRGVVEPARGSSGADWRLCADSALLAQYGLPAYGTTHHRYLCEMTGSGAFRFAPLLPDAPSNEHTVPISEGLGLDEDRFLLHDGGRLALLHPLGSSLESHIDALSSLDSPHGPPLGEPGCRPNALADPSPRQESGEGWLFTSNSRLGVSLVERAYLKLRLFEQMVRVVRETVTRRGAPLLDLGWDSFRVSMLSPGQGVPAFWTARAVLISPGDAIPTAVPGTDEVYYRSRSQLLPSVFAPVSLGRVLEGACEIRVVRVAKSGSESLLELKFRSEEASSLQERDLLRLRLPTRRGRVDFYCVYDASAGQGDGRRERTLVTLPCQISPELESELHAASAGFPLRGVDFAVVPMLTCAIDLYALAVLGVRALLVNDEVDVTDQLNELRNLADELRTEVADAPPLRERLRSLLDAHDSRWSPALGPHRMIRAGLRPAEALASVPAEWWAGVLATLLRCVPGALPESFCAGFSSLARERATNEVFGGPLTELSGLLAEGRRMIFRDPVADDELRRVLLGA